MRTRFGIMREHASKKNLWQWCKCHIMLTESKYLTLVKMVV